MSTLQIALYRKLVALNITPYIYEDQLPQDSLYPATVYSMIDAVPVGRSHDSNVTPFREERIQIDVFAESVADAKYAIERYFVALSSFDGPLGDGRSPESHYDVSVRYEATNPSQDFTNEVTTRNIKVRSMDFMIFYK
jgi:hypothetical protein